jgi:asparagine synthase (glutamine-hydrolysing)
MVTMVTNAQSSKALERYVHIGLRTERGLIISRQLPAGYFAVCRASGDIEIQSYWDSSYPATTAPPPTDNIDSMISTVRELLVEAVRLRLRSDVPLAVYLSGGIDSSAVAGIATSLLREKDPDAQLTTFTLAYGGM